MSLSMGTGQGINIIFDGDEVFLSSIHQGLSNYERGLIVTALRLRAANAGTIEKMDEFNALAEKVQQDDHLMLVPRLRELGESLIRTADERGL